MLVVVPAIALLPPALRVIYKVEVSNKVSLQSPIFLLNPCMDTESRLLMATPRTGEAKKVLLPYHSHLSKLIIWETHEKMYHAGVDRVVVEIHRKYWIVKLRRLVRSQLKACVKCQRYNGRPYGSKEGYLAPFRVDDTRPFKHTGVDFAGPVSLSASRSFYFYARIFLRRI